VLDYFLVAILVAKLLLNDSLGDYPPTDTCPKTFMKEIEHQFCNHLESTD